MGQKPAKSASHELDSPPWLRVESTLMNTAAAIRHEYDHRFAELDLNLSQAMMLAYVAEFGAESQTRIADRLGVGRAAAGNIVDTLERRGCVERLPDPDDRRVWLVQATANGKALAGRIAEIDIVFRADLRKGISREERQQLASLLLRLQKNLKSGDS